MRVVLNTKKVESLRKEMGYTKSQMSRELNVVTIQYSKLERGITGAGLQMLYKISKVLNTTMDQLIMEVPDTNNQAM